MKKKPRGEITDFFVLDTLKTAFYIYILNLTHKETKAFFPQKSVHFFQFSKKGRGDSPLPTSCALDVYEWNLPFLLIMQSALDQSNWKLAHCVGTIVFFNWHVCFGLSSATCEAMVSIAKFYQGINQFFCLVTSLYADTPHCQFLSPIWGTLSLGDVVFE